MKKITLLITLQLLIATGCKTAGTGVAKTVADEVVTIDANNFEFLDESLKGKDIVILGEASHGDGKTFEVKSQLVKYLIEQKGYNTFAFESRDFFEIEYINGRQSLENVLDKSLKHNWVRQWNPWGPAKEIQTLVDVLENGKLGYIGLEPYDYTSVINAVDHLKKRAEVLGLNVLDEKTWSQLQDIHSQVGRSYDSMVTAAEANYYVASMERLMGGIDANKGSESSFLYQMAENAVTFMKIRQLDVANLPDDEYYKFINLRDAQMAKNLIWYKKRNPDAKIIVWMANFHGANNLRDVQFADGDPTTYSKLTVFGEHIANKYRDKVYSIAFTSSRGTSKMPYTYTGIEETTITAPEGSLEGYLDVKNIDFGYIDFSEIRKNNPGLINKDFSSIMLGYANQNGKWLNVFDGVFYIRKNHNATPLNNE